MNPLRSDNYYVPNFNGKEDGERTVMSKTEQAPTGQQINFSELLKRGKKMKRKDVYKYIKQEVEAINDLDDL